MFLLFFSFCAYMTVHLPNGLILHKIFCVTFFFNPYIVCYFTNSKRHILKNIKITRGND